MAKVIFILGLCGSGKSYLSDRLKETTGAEVFENLLHNNASLVPELLQRLGDGKDCIVDEFQFCIPNERSKILQRLSGISGLELEWICYENDLESANWNVIRRTNKGNAEGHLAINRWLERQYVYPEGARIIPIKRI